MGRLNWLCKHIKKVRNSQAFISINCCTELIVNNDNDDDDDDDDDAKELFWWLTDERRLALFAAGTIARDPYHRKSPAHRKQDLNLQKIWVETLFSRLLLLNEVV